MYWSTQATSSCNGVCVPFVTIMQYDFIIPRIRIHEIEYNMSSCGIYLLIYHMQRIWVFQWGFVKASLTIGSILSSWEMMSILVFVMSLGFQANKFLSSFSRKVREVLVRIYEYSAYNVHGSVWNLGSVYVTKVYLVCQGTL